MPLTLWKPFRDIQRWEPLQEIESLRAVKNPLMSLD